MKRIVILRSSSEMKHPYEAALKRLADRVDWSTSLKELVERTFPEAPLAVVIDLDCLESPLEGTMEQLRTYFSDTELIALSGTDSSHLALQCIRSGFAEFLLKPASPEELAWAIQKVIQRQELLKKIDRPLTASLKAVTQISSAESPALVHLTTLEYVRAFLDAKGAAWVRKEVHEPASVLACIPKKARVEKILARFAKVGSTGVMIWKAKGSDSRKVIFPISMRVGEQVVVWGVPHRVASVTLKTILAIVEHASLSLQNIEKLAQIRHQTFLDDLTGLYNSRYLKYALNSAITKSQETGSCFSVLFIDVDHFKAVNDGHGHLVGSAFLVAIGKTIRNSVRQIDPVFRYGGDEFVVILNGTSLEGAREIAERIRKNVERRLFVIQDKRLQSTVSIGIATYPTHAVDREALLKLADEAMYSAKRDSRNAVHLALGVEVRDLSERSN